MNSKEQLSFDVAMDKVQLLHAGKLTCLYQHGKLRYIRHGDEEIVRTIYSAVRDENWNTAPYEISNEEIIQKDRGFKIRYTAHCRMKNIAYDIFTEITAEEDTIEFAIRGTALSDFKRNRIGICLLHPVSFAVQHAVDITNPSGTALLHNFPSTISPHQPAKDIRRMVWKSNSSNHTIEFFGDIFETEDQRNWTDSSFKTYSTPLELPLPVDVKTGEVVEQKILVIINEQKNTIAQTLSNESAVVDVPFPKVGFSKTPGQSLDIEEISMLQNILFNHYSVELYLSSAGWKNELHSAAGESKQLGVKLQLTCFFDDSYITQFAELCDTLRSGNHSPESILVLGLTKRSDPKTFHDIYSAIKQSNPSIAVGYGTNGHFADLNRNLPVGLKYDFVSFGVTPQAHSTDTFSLLENLDNQDDIIKTIRTHLGKIPIHVSPITFKARKQSLYSENGAPADFDNRQHLELGAAWVMRTLQNFAGTSVTLFDAVGYKGLISDEHRRNGKPSPLYELLRKLKAFHPVCFRRGLQKDELSILLLNEKEEEFVIELDQYFRNYRLFMPTQ